MNNAPDKRDDNSGEVPVHEVDGIQELDNLLPRWWVWLFYLCIAFAVAYFYFDWNLTRVLDFTWLSRAGSSLGRLMKPRPKLKVYDEEGEDAVHRELESEADRILAKISRDGEGSLSAQERKTLEHYSRLMRQKHR